MDCVQQILGRDRLRKRLTSLWDFGRAMTIYHRVGRYFQFRNSGLQNQDVLYVMDSPTASGRVLLESFR